MTILISIIIYIVLVSWISWVVNRKKPKLYHACVGHVLNQNGTDSVINGKRESIWYEVWIYSDLEGNTDTFLKEIPAQPML